METYLEKNKQYWDEICDGENVESWVFRTYGRILKPELKIDGSKGEKLLDFGCGGGPNAKFFKNKGFQVFGVDISKKAIEQCKRVMPDIKDNFMLVEPKPSRDKKLFNINFDVVIAIQSLYYFSDEDLNECLQSLYNQMNNGGIIYATMIGSSSEQFFSNSSDAGNGIRKVSYKTSRHTVKEHFINFVKSEEELVKKFSLFKKLHVGYYIEKYREDESAAIHYSFLGRKQM